MSLGGLVTFTLTEVVNSLSYSRPVYIRSNETSGGSGHAWVIDGYRKHEYSSSEVYHYLNMNWGWDGSSNGFYLTSESSPSYSAGGFNFYGNTRVICNIR